MGDRLIGSVLGPYRIERKLGEGGMGAVYAGRHVRTGRTYAIKVLLPDRALQTPSLSRFRREAEALGAIGHPHLVAIHDFDEAPDGVWFLAMDLLEGEDLGARLARTGAMPWRDAIDLLDPIASAISAAHRIGLIHRDIKPSNVFLAQPGGTGAVRPTLLDFGLARAVDGPELAPQSKLTASGVVIGTPSYMSPEQAQGLPLDARSDVWALGILLFEMCAGRTPFEAPTLASTLVAVLTSPRPRLSERGIDVPAALEAVLDRALAKAPEHRYPDVESFRRALGELGGPYRNEVASSFGARSVPPTQDAIAARRLSPEMPPKRGAGVVVAVVAAFAAIVVLLGASAGIVAWMLSQREDPTAMRSSPPNEPRFVPAIDEGSAPIAQVEAPPPREEPVDVAPAEALPEERPRARSRPRDRELTMDPDEARRREPETEAEAAMDTEAQPPSMETEAPGDPMPPGPSPAQLRAIDRMAENDFRGCIDELRSAGTSAPILGTRMNCALRTGRRNDLVEACDLLHRHQPRHPYTRTCDQMLALPPGALDTQVP
jgi:hypothetical protein